jgi:GntR family transcriptional regulator, histidine utilization repressor
MGATFKEVKADILDKITNGIWAPGSLIPNEIALAQTYDCARATVNRAMRELAEDGIIERKRKAGTRVRMAPLREARFGIPIVRKEIEDQGAEYRYALVQSAAADAPDWLRARLGLERDARVLHLTCMHYADGAPFQYEDRWINLDLLPQAETADFTASGPNEWLVAAIPFSNAEISFLAVEADDILAGHLECAPGVALFRLERTTWWQDAAVTLVRLTYSRGYRMTTQY